MSATPFSRRLLLPAAAVLVIGLVSRIPAGVALAWVLPDEVRTRAISGTIWAGKVGALEVAGVAFGPADWRLRPLGLLRGRLVADIEAGIPGGFFDGRVSAGPGALTLEDVRALADLAPLTRQSPVGSAQGTARISVDKATLEALWPSELRGDITVDGLRYAGAGNLPLGDYRLSFDGGASGDEALPVVGTLTSGEQAAFDVDGVLALGPNRAYALRATVAARPGAPDALSGALRMLPPASDDRRQLVLEGAL